MDLHCPDLLWVAVKFITVWILVSSLKLTFTVHTRSLAITTVFTCLTLLLINCSNSAAEVGVPLVFFFPGEFLPFLISSFLPPSSLSLSLSSLCTLEKEELQGQKEEDWIVMLSCALKFSARKLTAEDKWHNSNSTNCSVKELCSHSSRNFCSS